MMNQGKIEETNVTEVNKEEKDDKSSKTVATKPNEEGGNATEERIPSPETKENEATNPPAKLYVPK